MTETSTGARSSRWLWIAAIWCAGALFDASQTVLFMHALGKQHAWLIFGTELLSWLPWMLATPFVIHLAERHALFRGTIRTAAVHLAAFAVIALVAEAWFSALQMLFNPWEYPRRPTFMDAWRSSLLFQMLTFLIVYALILTFTYAMDARERMARQMMETARLSAELSRSQLAALRQQIEPHFMFNTLYSITGMVRDHKNDAAVSMIVGLSEFLRRALEDSHRSQVALAEEVEYLQRYLDIQKVRFGERLQVSVDIPAELLPAQVPNLLLQPLVENAIKHGIAKRAAGGAVRIAGARHDSKLCLRVYNDCPDSPTDWPATRTGVGISNLRARLQILYGNESELKLQHSDTGGVEVVVTLPLKEA
ncbi:MAG TPA: histidine kinase [Steroidobacteraceae bacterium]|jgi:two-component system LytT family sensor kinase|nr:histidine kinase [Steroidobacteraceae bacterium]